MMTHVLKNSLLVLAVAFAAVAQTSDANAQVAPTSAGVSEANAILDLATGEVTIQIGASLQIFKIDGIPFDNAAAVDGLRAIDPVPALSPGATIGLNTLNDASGIGVLKPNFLPVGEFSLGNILLTDFRTEAALTDFKFLFDGPSVTPINSDLGFPDHVFFVNGEAIPEPGSLSLLALAGLGAVARRRR